MEQFKIYCDGGSRGNPGPGAAAFVVVDEKDNIIFSEGKYLGRVTNNEAEYNGVLLALIWLEKNHEAPTGLRPGYLLPSLRRERNPSEAENSSHSSTNLRSWFSAKGDKNQKVNFFLDSLLVTNQLLGKYKIKEERLRVLANKIKAIEQRINEQIIYSHIPRIKNKLADNLVNQTLDKNQQ